MILSKFVNVGLSHQKIYFGATLTSEALGCTSGIIHQNENRTLFTGSRLIGSTYGLTYAQSSGSGAIASSIKLLACGLFGFKSAFSDNKGYAKDTIRWGELAKVSVLTLRDGMQILSMFGLFKKKFEWLIPLLSTLSPTCSIYDGIKNNDVCVLLSGLIMFPASVLANKLNKIR